LNIPYRRPKHKGNVGGVIIHGRISLFVAQVSNLLCRRLPAGNLQAMATPADWKSAIQQVGKLRYQAISIRPFPGDGHSLYLSRENFTPSLSNSRAWNMREAG
jgi:hypothetical protein